MKILKTFKIEFNNYDKLFKILMKGIKYFVVFMIIICAAYGELYCGKDNCYRVFEITK